MLDVADVHMEEAEGSNASPPAGTVGAPQPVKPKSRSGSQYKVCQCRVIIDGVHVCAQLNISGKQRGVSLRGLTESDLKFILTEQLGYAKNDPVMLMLAGKIADMRVDHGKQYRFNALHFGLEQLHFTAMTVRLKGLFIKASVPSREVLARTLLMREGMRLQDALVWTLAPLPAPAPAPVPPRRELPRVRVLARAFIAFARVTASQAGKRPVSDIVTPDRAATDAGRSPAPKVAARTRRLDLADMPVSAQRVLTAQYSELTDRSQLTASELKRAAIEARLLRSELRASEEDGSGLRVRLATEKEAYAEKLADVVELTRANEHLLEQLRARDVVHDELRRAASQQRPFARWHTSHLEEGRPLASVIRALTGFRDAVSFRTFFATVMDWQGREGVGAHAPGCASRLDYYYAANHNPGSRATSGSRSGLSSLKPAGLDGPIEACFLTYVMLRCGLSAEVVGVLFGVSAGSASQIFNTWVPFISYNLQFLSEPLTAAEVRGALPKKFVSGPLSRTTHSAKCRMIIDCTEVWVQAPADPTLRKLYYSQYKGHCTLKWLIGITPGGVLAFVSAGFPGSTSDDAIVEASGLLELFERGDAIMADRGFSRFHSLREHGIDLIIPSLSLTQGNGNGAARAPFTEEENRHTYYVAQVRIHVERLMRAIKGGWRCYSEMIPQAKVGVFSQHIMQITARMTLWEHPLQGLDYLDR